MPQAAGSATDNVACIMAPALAELIRHDSAKWAEVVHRSGAKID